MEPGLELQLTHTVTTQRTYLLPITLDSRDWLFHPLDSDPTLLPPTFSHSQQEIQS